MSKPVGIVVGSVYIGFARAWKRKLMTNIYPLFTENLAVPVHDLVNGTSRFKYSHILQKTQWFTRREIERLQSRNLRKLIKHVYETVPYYRRIFRERNLSPGDIKEVNDLRKLPILTKADIRNNFRDLISQGFSGNLISCSSGGTGDQINFYTTKEEMSWVFAAEYRAYGWAGYKLGNRCYMLWGSPIDVSIYTRISNRFINALNRKLILNSYVVSEEVLEKLANALRRFRPEIIRGYASSVYILAKYLLEIGVEFEQPRAVITSSESLLSYMRETIEEAFSCPVFDFYGSREIGSLASECQEHSGFHITAENVVLEFVRDGEPVTVGEKGEILVTSLRNFGMPFIRYDIKDVGVPSDDDCNCGRGLPLASSIEGRVSQFMAIRDKQTGRILPVSTAGPGLIGGALLHIPLDSFRIIQESLDKLVIEAVKGKNYSQNHTDFLIKHVQKYLGDSILVEIKFLDSIPPLPSGKRSVFISKIDPFKSQE